MKVKVQKIDGKASGDIELNDDVFGVESLPSHHLPLAQAADAYKMFLKKDDRCIKVVLQP